MIRVLCVVAASLAMAACETDIGYAMLSDAELEKKDTPTLIHAYSSVVNVHQAPRVEKVLKDRGVFTDDEWARIKAQKIRIGDSMDVVLASWGAPDDKNEVLTATGKTSIWRWGQYRGDAAVWFDGDRVSLIHD